jgi:hypothetical protein
MKRLFALFLMIVLAIFLSSSIALASGYLDDATIQGMTDPTDPHGGYTNSTNRCKACHAVHLAEGSYRLLRTDSSSTECDYCHGNPSGIISTATKVKGNTTEGHTMGYSGDAPDDTDTAWNTSGLKCADCHSVHDNNTVQLADLSSTNMLKENPDGEGSAFTSSSYETEWCADCHGANRGLYSSGKTVGGETRYSHDSSDAGWIDTSPADGWPDESPDATNNGPTCKQCHQASAFPHDAAGSSEDLLKDSYGGSSLDDVCNDCHNTASLP